jgi:hypothetical protein
MGVAGVSCLAAGDGWGDGWGVGWGKGFSFWDIETVAAQQIKARPINDLSTAGITFIFLLLVINLPAYPN